MCAGWGKMKVFVSRRDRYVEVDAMRVTWDEQKAPPDFELVDTNGRTVRLADYRGQKHVVLVLARGFL